MFGKLTGQMTSAEKKKLHDARREIFKSGSRLEQIFPEAEYSILDPTAQEAKVDSDEPCWIDEAFQAIPKENLPRSLRDLNNSYDSVRGLLGKYIVTKAKVINQNEEPRQYQFRDEARTAVVVDLLDILESIETEQTITIKQDKANALEQYCNHLLTGETFKVTSDRFPSIADCLHAVKENYINRVVRVAPGFAEVPSSSIIDSIQSHIESQLPDYQRHLSQFDANSIATGAEEDSVRESMRFPSRAGNGSDDADEDGKVAVQEAAAVPQAPNLDRDESHEQWTVAADKLEEFRASASCEVLIACSWRIQAMLYAYFFDKRLEYFKPLIVLCDLIVTSSEFQERQSRPLQKVVADWRIKLIAKHKKYTSAVKLELGLAACMRLSEQLKIYKENLSHYFRMAVLLHEGRYDAIQGNFNSSSSFTQTVEDNFNLMRIEIISEGAQRAIKAILVGQCFLQQYAIAALDCVVQQGSGKACLTNTDFDAIRELLSQVQNLLSFCGSNVEVLEDELFDVHVPDQQKNQHLSYLISASGYKAKLTQSIEKFNDFYSKVNLFLSAVEQCHFSETDRICNADQDDVRNIPAENASAIHEELARFQRIGRSRALTVDAAASPATSRATMHGVPPSSEPARGDGSASKLSRRLSWGGAGT